MAGCECLASCPFFNDLVSSMPASAGLIRTLYCLGEYGNCARYRVFKALGDGQVPPTLFPNDTKAADRIILSARTRPDARGRDEPTAAGPQGDADVGVSEEAGLSRLQVGV
jgi:hypothetical protein